MHGMALARLCGAKVLAVYVMDKFAGCGPSSCVLSDTDRATMSLMESLNKEGDRATRYVEDLAKKEGLEVERIVVEGNPAEEIMRLANERSADLIVMGTLGATGIKKYLLGSVASKIVQHSVIPVLTIRK